MKAVIEQLGPVRKPTSKGIPFAKGVMRDKADRLWSLAVRADWDWECAACLRQSAQYKIEAHHVLPRQHETTRYLTRNGIGLCTDCHKFNIDMSPHQNAEGWIRWLSEHELNLHQWYVDAMDTNWHKAFNGVKNATYYCDVIRELEQYVEPGDYERILGVKFSRWLTENT